MREVKSKGTAPKTAAASFHDSQFTIKSVSVKYSEYWMIYWKCLVLSCNFTCCLIGWGIENAWNLANEGTSWQQPTRTNPMTHFITILESSLTKNKSKQQKCLWKMLISKHFLERTPKPFVIHSCVLHVSSFPYRSLTWTVRVSFFANACCHH